MSNETPKNNKSQIKQPYDIDKFNIDTATLAEIRQCLNFLEARQQRILKAN